MELIRYGEYNSPPPPLGTVFVARTERGICRVSIGIERDVFIEGLKEEYGPGVEEAPAPSAIFAPVVRLFDGYFAGTDPGFDLPLDLRGGDFEVRVWGVLREIPFGEVRSYGWVARRAGEPGAARAVGGACGKNPVPIIVPCHRVVLSSGDIGGYSCGVSIKRALLDLEGCPRTESGRFALKTP